MQNNNQIATIGAGSLLVKDYHLLLVQLNYGKFKGSWILPGGMVETGESPDQSAIRETKEETNLDVGISKLVTVRHRINENHNNLYFVFEATTTETLSSLNKNLAFPKQEIMDVQFWPIEEVHNSDAVRPLTKYYLQHYLTGAATNIDSPEVSTFKDRVYNY